MDECKEKRKSVHPEFLILANPFIQLVFSFLFTSLSMDNKSGGLRSLPLGNCHAAQLVPL